MNKQLERLLQLHTNLSVYEGLSDKDGKEYECLIKLISDKIDSFEDEYNCVWGGEE